MAYLTFLIVIAMLLINVVMVKIEERDLVQAKLETGRLLLHTLAQQVGYETGHERKMGDRLFSRPSFRKKILRAMQIGGFSDALIVDTEGVKVYSIGSWDSGPENEALALSRNTLTMRKWAFDFYGSTWGVIWPAHERINISSPLFHNPIQGGRYRGVGHKFWYPRFLHR